MMTDEELLKLAAKSAGLRIIKWGKPYFESHRYGEVAYVTCAKSTEDVFGDEWNPLTDDGDALRLAVKLGLSDGFVTILVRSESGDDPYAATRRAIVRTAAEIGKSITNA
jgi:hypothetical protein